MEKIKGLFFCTFIFFLFSFYPPPAVCGSDNPLFDNPTLFNSVSVGGPGGSEVWAVAASTKFIYNYEHYWIERGSSEVKTFIDVSVAPDGNTIWAVADGNKMWKYIKNSGWSEIPDGTKVSLFTNVSVGGPNGSEVWAVADSTNLIYRYEKGANNRYDWIEKGSSAVRTFIDVSVAPDGKTIWAVADGNKMWKYSKDDGWSVIPDGTEVSLFNAVSTGGPDGNEIWAIAASTNLIYRYEKKSDNQYDWIEKGVSEVGMFIDVSVAPDGKTVWAVATGNMMWKYTAEKGWKPLNGNLQAVYSNPEKPSVIFIHGHNDSPSAWSKILEELMSKTDFMRRYNILTFTYDSNWAINDIGALLKTQIETREIKKPIIVAHSMGGLVARAYVALGGSVTKLVTFASPHMGSSYLPSKAGKYFSPSIKDMCTGSQFLEMLENDSREKKFRDRYAFWAGEEGKTTYDGMVNTQSAWMCSSCNLDACEPQWRKDVNKQGQLSPKCIKDCPCDSNVNERYYENISHTEFLDPQKNPSGYSYIASYLLPYQWTRNAAIKGHNARKLNNVTPADCAKACDDETAFYCKSFDYYKNSKACSLSDKNASDVGGLKTNYENNPYDHYSRGTVRRPAEFFSRWMSNDEKIQQSSLLEITIPGAHDAGMGKIGFCTPAANGCNTQTQDKAIIQMLNAGIRYFDIRPIIGHDGKMYLGHYDWVSQIGSHQGCFGYSMAEILEEVKNFVSTSSFPPNREVVVLKMSHFKNLKKYDNKDSHFDADDFAKLKEIITYKLDAYLIKKNTDFLQTPINELTADGAKVIVTFEPDGYDGSDGIYSQHYLKLYDSYANSNDFNVMKIDQFKKMEDKSSSHYFVLSWTLTLDTEQAVACAVSGSLSTSIKSLANAANAMLHLIPEESEKKKKYTNVIYADFVNSLHTENAILINHYR